MTTAAVALGQMSVGRCDDAVDARRDIGADSRGGSVVAGTVGMPFL
ncbi:hypothetical protein ACFRDV_27460 [Streptomyces fagopyri]